VEVVKDVFTGVSRGFGYVEMEETAGRAAIAKLNQTTVNNLTVKVLEAPTKKSTKRVL
jgi:RNA recognition motif-containing protein